MIAKFWNILIALFGGGIALWFAITKTKNVGKRELQNEQAQQTLKEALDVKQANEKRAGDGFSTIADQLRKYEIPDANK